jgi:hypothetical protein
MLPFRLWLEDHRLQQVPDATSAAFIAVRSGAAGVSREGLARVLGAPGEDLESLLRAMAVAGQVVMVSVGGKIGYRAVG